MPSADMGPYPYAAPLGFDGMVQAQFPQQHIYGGAPVNPSAAGTGASNAGSPAGTQYQTAPPGVSASYPFGSNPYYPNQYYYGAQAPFYYGQPGARGMYAPAQYSGTAQGGYSDIYGQPGMGAANQFSDAGPYGAMPMPLQGASQVPPSGAGGKGPKSNASTANGSSATSSGSGAPGSSGPLPQNVNEMMSHQYGAYGAYSREAWMMHQPWAAPMMPFAGVQSNPSQAGFGQPNMGQQAQQQGRGDAAGNRTNNRTNPGSGTGAPSSNNWSS
jgi:hypothetical protein